MTEKISLNTVQENFPSLDTARRIEVSRQVIAYLIVGALLFTVVSSFITLWAKSSPLSSDDIVKVIQAIISPVIGIVGAVTGFYFGEKRSEPSKN